MNNNMSLIQRRMRELVRHSQSIASCSPSSNSPSLTIKDRLTNNGLAKPFKSIPGPKSLPILGSLLNYVPLFGGEYTFDRLHRTGRLKYEQYGKLVREEIVPGINLLYLFDPVDIETLFSIEGKYPSRMSHLALEKYRIVDTPEQHPSAGLLPTNGEEWGKLRRVFQKALASEHIRKLIPATDNIVQEFVYNIANVDDMAFYAKNNFLPHLMGLALELVGANFFGVRFSEEHKTGRMRISPKELVEAAEKVNSLTLETEKGLRLWRWINTPNYLIIKENTILLESAARHFVNLHLENHDTILTKNSVCILKDWLKDSEKDTKNIVTMSADMILAGIDTTSYSLGFAFYHLATHPKCQERLFEELKRLLPTANTEFTSETLASCSYLKRVIKESLRLNPISIGTGRMTPKDSIIGGYHVPAQTYCITQNQVACRFPEYFENPNEFIPERWAPENRKMAKVHPYLLLPFGFGPRACIGRRLAEQQMYIITARLVRNFVIEWKGKEKLDCISTTINKPDSPLLFNFIRRPQ